MKNDSEIMQKLSQNHLKIILRSFGANLGYGYTSRAGAIYNCCWLVAGWQRVITVGKRWSGTAAASLVRATGRQARITPCCIARVAMTTGIRSKKELTGVRSKEELLAVRTKEALRALLRSSRI